MGMFYTHVTWQQSNDASYLSRSSRRTCNLLQSFKYFIYAYLSLLLLIITKCTINRPHIYELQTLQGINQCGIIIATDTQKSGYFLCVRNQNLQSHEDKNRENMSPVPLRQCIYHKWNKKIWVYVHLYTSTG